MYYTICYKGVANLETRQKRSFTHKGVSPDGACCVARQSRLCQLTETGVLPDALHMLRSFISFFISC